MGRRANDGTERQITGGASGTAGGARTALGSTWRFSAALIAGALALLSSCDGGAQGERATITESRIAATAYLDGSRHYSLRERLLGPQVDPDGTNAEPPTPRLGYGLPDGWEALPPQPLRRVNLRHKTETDSQLIVAVFQDRAGPRANFDRWRGEVELEPLSDEAFAALERDELFGVPAQIIELEGSYTGIGGLHLDEALVFGAIAQAGSDSIFVKMVVPVSLREGARATFVDFLDSLRLEVDVPPRPTGGTVETERVSPLTWGAPEGWSEEPPNNSFREVTFRREELEMYVSLARGDVTGNIARWAGQIGLAPPTPDEFNALQRVPSLGVEAIVFEGAGTLRSMLSPQPIPGQRMLAAIVQPKNVGDTIVTLKLTGPDAAVMAAKADFEALLRSLAFRSQ